MFWDKRANKVMGKVDFEHPGMPGGDVSDVSDSIGRLSDSMSGGGGPPNEDIYINRPTDSDTGNFINNFLETPEWHADRLNLKGQDRIRFLDVYTNDVIKANLFQDMLGGDNKLKTAMNTLGILTSDPTFMVQLVARAFTKGEELSKTLEGESDAVKAAISDVLAYGMEVFSPGGAGYLKIPTKSKATDLKVANYIVTGNVDGTIDPRDAATYDRDTYQKEITATADMLSQDGRDAFDMSQSMGTPQWLTDYIRKPDFQYVDMSSAFNITGDTNDNTVSGEGNPVSNDGNPVSNDGTEDEETESLWTQYIDKVVEDLEPSIIGSKDYLSSEAEKYTDTTRGLTDQRQTVLDRLRRELETETGTFEPTQTKWGDYQSGKNIQSAQTLASLADRTYNNQASQAERLLSTAQATDPYLGQLSYLAALESIASQDKTFNQRDAELILKRYGIDADADTALAQIEANEPGWFENILNVGQVAIPLLDDSGAWGDEGWLYSTGDDAGGLLNIDW